MNLEQCRPHPQELAKILAANRLFPDVWKTHPTGLIATMQSSVFWLLKGKTRVIGMVWLSNIVEGETADLHILLNKQFRQYMRPKRRIRPRRVDNGGVAKMLCLDEVLEYCFGTLDLRRISGLVPKSRKAAGRLCRNLGFSYEGCMEDAIKLSGKVDDLTIWGYTAEAYASRAQAEKSA